VRPTLASIVLVPALLGSLAACSHPTRFSAEARIATDRGPVTLHVRIADTDAARRRGLQGVTRLADDAGMAFLFDRSSTIGFWMKDTSLPLSIAFWGRDGRIVAMMDMAPCAADPCATYRPHPAYVGAVEARWGFFVNHGVEVGDRIAIVGD
jgi:uncharacterized protein